MPKTAHEYKLWSPSIVGSIYFDEDGNWWVYREKNGKLVGISGKTKGKTARVIPKSFNYQANKLKAIM